MGLSHFLSLSFQKPMPNFFSVLQADLHNFILLWLVTHSEIPLSICSGIRSQWEQTITVNSGPCLPTSSAWRWRQKAEAKDRDICAEAIRQV